MKKVITIPNSNLAKHDCSAAVLKCIDWRFRKTDQEFIEKGLGIEDFDLYSWPGAAKEVLGENGFKQIFQEKIIAVSRNLHNINKLILLWHWDCGGYGGSKAFVNSKEEEQAYQKDLLAAKETLVKNLPQDIEIIMSYSKKNGEDLDYFIID